MDPWQIVAVLATALAGSWSTFIVAFFKGDLIPGHVYRREIERGDTMTTQAERNADALLAQMRKERGYAPSGGPRSPRALASRPVVSPRGDRGSRGA